MSIYTLNAILNVSSVREMYLRGEEKSKISRLSRLLKIVKKFLEKMVKNV